jgi:hypothetical protein
MYICAAFLLFSFLRLGTPITEQLKSMGLFSFLPPPTPSAVLQTAAERGDYATVCSNLHLSGNLATGHSALMLAASNNHVECVRVLAEHESTLVNVFRSTALMQAASHGHPDSSRLLLLSEGAMLSLSRPCGSGLLWACRNPSPPPLFAQLLPTPPASPGFDECVALHLPREFDVSSEHADVLAECNSDVKRTIVDAFVRYRHLTADDAAELSDNDAKVAFRIVAQCGNLDAVLALAPRCAGTLYYRGRPAVTYAICEGHAGIVQALLPFEAGIVDEDGWSNLRLALAVGIAHIVALLAAVPAELTSLHLGAKEPTDYCLREDCLAVLRIALAASPQSV